MFCLEAGRESQGFSSTGDVSLAFWRQNGPLTGTWDVLFRLTGLPLGSGYLSLPRAEIKSTYHHTQHFYPGCGIKLRSSGKHLPLSADQQSLVTKHGFPRTLRCCWEMMNR